MSTEHFSLRMRSNRGEKHISGAEGLLAFDRLETVASAMLLRALHHPRGPAEHICLTLESVSHETVRRESLLPLSTYEVSDWRSGRQCACLLLKKLGLKSGVVRDSMAQLAAGPAPGGESMRGAMLIDAISGRRLEADQSRGVRVSRMDADPAASEAIDLLLNGQSLANPRVLEAWILASKVALYPQIVAELCWSDDPDYLTGYVASAQFGYQRITHLKEAGSQIGGRIFFVQTGSDLGALVTKLQSEPVLFSSPMTEFP